MKLLTRAEEYILLAVWRLKGKGYTLIIQDEIETISGERWSLGTIYAPLERLEKRGYISSTLSESVPERGGRQKRCYNLTPDGERALLKMKSVHDTFWADLPSAAAQKAST